jgi:hypothetical protein
VRPVFIKFCCASLSKNNNKQTNKTKQKLFCCVQGEGVAYRGRALVELATVLGETPEIPVEPIDNDDILRVQV